MTVEQLKNILDIVSEETPIRCTFKFSSCSTGYGAVIKSATVEYEQSVPQVVLNIEENEEEKAAMQEVMAA